MEFVSRIQTITLRDVGRAIAGAYSPYMLLLAPLLLLLAAVYFLPILAFLWRSLFDPDLTLAHYQAIFQDPLYLSILGRTLRTGFICTALALVLAYPVAYVMSRARGRRESLLLALVLLPLWTSSLVRSYVWIVLLQRRGIMNEGLRGLGVIDEPLYLLYTEGAVIMAMTNVLLPFMILPIYAVLRGIPRELPQAAHSLGASSFEVFWRVTLPLSLPGVAAGGFIVFIQALGFYVTPALVGGPQTLMLSTLIGQQASVFLNWPLAGALSMLLLTVTLSLVVLFERRLGLGRIAGQSL